MKFKITLLALLFISITRSYGQTDERILSAQFPVEDFSKKYFNSKYKKNNWIGQVVDGYRNGRWLAISADSIIYNDCNYKMGIPIGTWRLNFPSGTPRVVTNYSDDGDVLMWKRYKALKPVIEISNENGLLPEFVKTIKEAEIRIFNAKLGEYQTESKTSRTTFYGQPGMQSISYTATYDEVKALHSFLDFIIKNGVDCKVILFNNGEKTKGKLLKEVVIKNGFVFTTVEYTYKGKHLTEIHYSESGTPTKVEYYNKKGDIKKVLKIP